MNSQVTEAAGPRLGGRDLTDVPCPVYGMLERPSMVDFPGRLACVLFTTGCNFSCGFCHNAPLLGERKPGLTWERLDSACREFRQSWVRGAVVTGGEPTLWRSLPQLLEFLSGHGFQLKLDTNGSRPADLERVLERLDYVAMDVKCSLARYEGFVRFADTDAIARSLDLIRERAADYEFRTTVIEGVHTVEEMQAIGELVRGARRFVLQPFLPRPDLPDPGLRALRRTPPQVLAELRDVMVPYVGEVLIRGE